MTKSNKWLKNNAWNLVMLGVILALIGVIYYGGQHDWFKGIINIPGSSYVSLEPKDKTLTTQYSLSIAVTPRQICLGDDATGTIVSNMYNSLCSIYINPNNAGWQYFANVVLDAKGFYSHTQAVNVLGTAVFKVLCIQGQYYAVSNEDSLTVVDCSGDSDGDGYSDEEENEAGTDPHDPTSHPESDGDGQGSTTCNAICSGAGYGAARGPVSSPGYCNSPEISVQITGFSQWCCCIPLDGASSSYTCGQGEDKQCMGTCPPTYPSCASVEFGSGSSAYETCVCINEQTQMIHPDWKPDGSMHNEDLYMMDSAECGAWTSSMGFVFGSARPTYIDYAACQVLATTECANQGKSLDSSGQNWNCCGWKCKDNIPNSPAPGTGWSTTYHPWTDSWYMAAGSPTYWYPFYFNAGNKYITVHYDFSHWQTGDFTDTTNPARIRVKNNGVVVCSRDIITNSQRIGDLLCIGTTTGSWITEVQNAKTENINTRWGYYTWTG